MSRNRSNMEVNPVPIAAIFALLFVMFIPEYSFAHSAESTGFVSGFLHPILGLDHLVAMVAVGILGALIGGRAVWLLPVCFPLVMALGGVLGIKGVPLPYAETLIAASAVAFGILIVIFRKISVVPAALIVAFFAIFHGHAHGVELPEAMSPVEYCVGFIVGTGLLHTAGILISLLEKKSHGPAILRGIGAVIGATGCYFLVG